MEDLGSSWFPFQAFLKPVPPLPFPQFSYMSQEMPFCLNEEKLGAYCLQAKSPRAIVYLPGVLWRTHELVHIVVAMVPGTSKSWNVSS